MAEFGVNLKRFDISSELGGICPYPDPVTWIEEIIDHCVRLGLGTLEESRIRLFPPESLLYNAQRRLCSHAAEKRRSLMVGSQSVYRENTAKGGNFGAFTANLPAAAVKTLGPATTLLGHSEERSDKFEQLLFYDPSIATDPGRAVRANHSVNQLIGREVAQALKAKLAVMLCVGETAEEKGEDCPEKQEEQGARIGAVLEDQLQSALAYGSADVGDADIVIAYEPRWAIGPGKTPPNAAYIDFISSMIKALCTRLAGRALPVLYGGGLKRENAAQVASVGSIDGGLVALTNFSSPIGFDPEEFKVILQLFMKAKGSTLR